MNAITKFTPAEESLLTATARAFRARIVPALQRLQLAWEHRAAMAVLARLDERALGDIGLSRSDVRDAVAQPWWHDPTTLLEQRRGERRSARLPSRQAPPLAPNARARRHRPSSHII